MTRTRTLCTLAVLALGLAACGKQAGELERPGPLWGPDARARAAAAHADPAAPSQGDRPDTSAPPQGAALPDPNNAPR